MISLARMCSMAAVLSTNTVNCTLMITSLSTVSAQSELWPSCVRQSKVTGQRTNELIKCNVSGQHLPSLCWQSNASVNNRSLPNPEKLWDAGRLPLASADHFVLCGRSLWCQSILKCRLKFICVARYHIQWLYRPTQQRSPTQPKDLKRAREKNNPLNNLNA